MKKFSWTVFKNSAFGFISQITIKVVSFCFSVFIVRKLGADVFGQYSTISAFGMTFAFLADLGLSVYSVREIARLRGSDTPKEKIDAIYSNILSLRLILSVITVILVTVAAWLTGRPAYMVIAIGLSSLGLLMYAVEGASEAVLMGFERLDVISLSRVINQIVFIVIGTIVLVLGLGYFGLILSSLIAIALMTVVCWRGVHKLGVLTGKPTPDIWTGMIRASIPFGIINFALGLSYKFDTILLNIYRGNAETGIYNVAYNLVFSAVMFSNVISTALYPSLVVESAKAPENLPRIYSRSIRYLMLIAFPIAVGTWAIAFKLVPFLYTSNYLPAIQALQLIIWVVPLMYMTEFLGYIVVIANQEKIVTRSIVISSSFNILVNILLVPRFGYIAAAIMTVLTEAVLVSQYLWTLRDKLGQFNFLSGLIRPLLSAAAMGVVLVLTRDSLELPALIGLGILTYGLATLIFKAIDKEDLRFIRRLRSSARETSEG